ncbi:hypothetical protein X798_07035 [Onchocerca flexuosa]|uniref:Uncharacterized protein n=1 Tax=Onchocerca flexuosa TaxID=387005 RepID=A0A238BL99_9BILA|nr:hypothetical protein X798_07035 [Onchocerca flexuosa]
MVIIRPLEHSSSNANIFNTQTFRVSLRRKQKECDDKDMEHINDDLSYLNCNLLVPSSIFAAISLAAILIGSTLGHFYDIKRREDGNISSWLFASGWYSKYCVNFTPTMIPDWYLPSILRLFELTVQANVSFRIATCIPTSLRLFQSYLNTIVNAHFCPDTKEWLWYRWCNAAVPILLLLEITFCTLFSINTIRQDYQTATIYRRNRKFEIVDKISVTVKLLCLIAFSIVTPHVAIFHNTFIDFPACHYYAFLCIHVCVLVNVNQ